MSKKGDSMKQVRLSDSACEKVDALSKKLPIRTSRAAIVSACVEEGIGAVERRAMGLDKAKGK